MTSITLGPHNYEKPTIPDEFKTQMIEQSASTSPVTASPFYHEYLWPWDGILKLLRRPGIDSKESILQYTWPGGPVRRPYSYS
jgi:hypothetical protein